MTNKVSVILSTYTEERYESVVKCVDSLLKQSLPPDQIILAVDSREELLNFYREKISGVEVVDRQGHSLSRARNSGITRSVGDLVVFIDDDAYADVDWLKTLIAPFDDELVVSTGGRIEPDWAMGRPWWLPEELFWVVGCTYRGMPVDDSLIRNPIGCNMAFRKRVFDEIGFFNEDIGRIGFQLLGSEEMELCLRIPKANKDYRILYVPESVVHHQVPRSRSKFSYLLKRSYFEGASKAIIGKLYPKNESDTTENHYLYYLIKTGIPSRFLKLYSYRAWGELGALVASVASVACGFLWTSLFSRKARDASWTK